jgi:nitroreductase
MAHALWLPSEVTEMMELRRAGHGNKSKATGWEKASALRLPEPFLTGKTTVAEALRSRRTTREMTEAKLDVQLLSNLLFAASGVNRRQGPFGSRGITAASASNSQEIRVYVALEEGAFLFEPDGHALAPVSGEDLRPLALGPRQPPISPKAPVQLIFVVDIDKLEHTAGFDEPGLHDPEVQKSYYFVDTGLIAGNVYLFAASEGLACWFHNCDRTALAKKLMLGEKQRVLFAQTVGYPAKAMR